MATNRHRQSRKIARSPLLDFVRILLMDGPEATHKVMMDRMPGSGKIEAFMMRKTPRGAREAWLLHKKEIMRQWKAEKRWGLPWGAKQFDNEHIT